MRGMSSSVRVAVCTSQPVVGAGLATILRHSGGVLVPTPLAEVGGSGPDVVLYDVVLLAGGDVTGLEDLVMRTSAPVLLLASPLRPDLTARGLSHGAQGYVDLEAPPDDVVAAVCCAASGPRVDGVGAVLSTPSRAPASADLPTDEADLSDREGQVLALIAQGYSNKQVAEQLFIGVNTVKTYIRSTYAKIGARNRAMAVAWAVERGFRTRR